MVITLDTLRHARASTPEDNQTSVSYSQRDWEAERHFSGSSSEEFRRKGAQRGAQPSGLYKPLSPLHHAQAEVQCSLDFPSAGKVTAEVCVRTKLKISLSI